MENMTLLIVGSVLLVFILVTLAQGVRIVPQGSQYVVERLGKFLKVMNPGLNFIVPFVDRVRYKMSTRDMMVDIEEQSVVTEDNAIIIADAVAYIKILDAQKAAYGVDNYKHGTEQRIMTTLRAVIGEMKLDEALSSREEINERLKNALKDSLTEWGIKLQVVEVKEIRPSPSMAQAMEQQAAAERQKRATISLAEGERESRKLRSEGELEASRNEAEARKVLADAMSEAIEKVSRATEGNDAAVSYLLGEKFIAAMQELAGSKNSKIILLPSNIQDAVSNMFGGKQKSSVETPS